MDYNEFSLPPGCKSGVLSHPSGEDEAIELALFQDHRYAFFFWSKWTRKANAKTPPALVSLDWHEDLAAPCEGERKDLKRLDQSKTRDLALFCWEGLNPNNDGHILAAAYLNLIGDIYVVRKQDGESAESFRDAHGNAHNVHCFDTFTELTESLSQSQVERVYFDIDLDYFTESPDPCGGGSDVELVADDEVRRTIDPRGPLMRWLFKRLAGMTIATEPEFCGGIVQSNHLLSLISETLFDPQILADDSAWLHLAK